MKKSLKYFLIPFIIFIIILGFFIPSIFQRFYPIDPFLKDSYSLAVDPLGGLLLAAKRIENNGQYPDRCSERNYKQILLQTYSWMMIKGPVIEICADFDEKGSVSGIKSLGTFSNYYGVVIVAISFFVGLIFLIKYLIGFLFFHKSR